MKTQKLTQLQKDMLLDFLKQQYPESSFSYEVYGRPQSVEGVEIIHMITKTGTARIDGVVIGTYKHDYLHPFEVMVKFDLFTKL